MATVAITPDQDAVQLDVHIAAPPERVFQALTDPRQLMQWWGQKGMYHAANWTTDVRPGGKWRCDGVSDTDGSAFNVSGEYIEINPPKTIVYTWLASWTGSLKTTVRWTLEPAAGGTRVQLKHTGFAGAPDAAKNHGQGWQRVTAWMQAFLEKGETVSTRAPFTPPKAR